MRVPSKALTIAILAAFLTSCAASTSDLNSEISDGSSAQISSTADTNNDGSETASVDIPDATQAEASSGDASSDSSASNSMDSSKGRAERLSANETTRGTAANEITQPVSIRSVDFVRDGSGPGMVAVALNEEAPYIVRKTAPTEYVLEIPGGKFSAEASAPKLAPSDYKGIRSARVTQEGDRALVRMFVEEGVDLKAVSNQTTIYLKPEKSIVSRAMESARGQLADPKKAAPEEQKPAEAAAPQPSASDLGIRSADGSKVYTGRLISLDLQDTDIDNALRIIAEVSNLNIIASDDVRGKVTLRLIDVPWDQALDVILRTNGLDQVSEGNVVRIAPVDKLRAEREALLEAKRAQENLEDLTVRYIRISYAHVDDLQPLVEAVLTERGTVAADERTNQLIVKDIAKGHDEALALVSKIDLRTPQVLLETQIVEADKSLMRDLGFQWNYQYIASPATGNATGLVFPNSVQLGGSTAGSGSQLGGDLVSFPATLGTDAGSALGLVLDSADGSRLLAARLTALEDEGRARVISRPQVATVNNKQAEIKSVETLRIKLPDSGLSVATGSGASSSGGGSSAFEEIDVGIELQVTPQASPDYFVLMDVHAKSSALGTIVVDNIPSTIEREATSTILVKSGQTFALGGVYRVEDGDTVQGVPFLKDIPFLGHFFSGRETKISDEELIFFITPHIVEGSFDPSLM